MLWGGNGDAVPVPLPENVAVERGERHGAPIVAVGEIRFSCCIRGSPVKAQRVGLRLGARLLRFALAPGRVRQGALQPRVATSGRQEPADSQPSGIVGSGPSLNAHPNRRADTAGRDFGAAAR